MSCYSMISSALIKLAILHHVLKRFFYNVVIFTWDLLKASLLQIWDHKWGSVPLRSYLSEVLFSENQWPYHCENSKRKHLERKLNQTLC